MQKETTESLSARYVVGIDLGTTNCAVAFVDTRGGGRVIEDFPIPQYTAPGVRESRDTLPSFLYALLPEEGTENDERVDANYRAGTHARDHGMLTPGRLIASTKSWLCHGGVDRTSALLPWHAAEDVKPLSPVQAQAVLLKHMRDAWDEAHPQSPLAEQDVYITVPASFDEVARELTIEAARDAGLPALVLIEEPQAAFYAWLSRHEQSWTKEISPDDHILICDVGGGTTDLTLIHARPGEEGTVAFHRTAVGDHLILGGDNLDLALAQHVESKLEGELSARDWYTLARLCRHYKEILLGPDCPEEVRVNLPGTGSGVLRGGRQATLTREETERLLLDGFLPEVELDSRPARRSSGFQEFGLPFAPDPAITKYLAEFLRTNLPADASGQPVAPQAVLLNGGLFESTALRARFKSVLSSWFTGASIHWLDHRRLDLAVARGAAYFGMVRRGLGVRVLSDLARSYYIGIERAGNAAEVLCLAPAGLAPGHPVRIDEHPLRARLKMPVEFPLYVSSRRTTDRAGEFVALDEESFKPLPPLRTVLTAGKQATQQEIDVYVQAALTEVGALDLRIVESQGARSWKLSIDLRAATRTDMSFHDGRGERGGLVDSERIEAAEKALRAYFQGSAAEMKSTSPLKALEHALDLGRGNWPASVLRALWACCIDCIEVRDLSAAHEARWLNLLGYCLRPGFGVALDDWRVATTWKRLHGGMANPANEAVRSEWWILWRRLAGGLSAGQQGALAGPVLVPLKLLFGGKPKARLGDRDLRLTDHETVELVRMLALLERLPGAQREPLGGWLLEGFILNKAPTAHRRAAFWALGRIGARVPLYGPMEKLLPVEQVEPWIEALLQLEGGGREQAFALMSISRRTGDRYRDLGETLRGRVAAKLRTLDAPAHWVTLVEAGGQLDEDEESQSFGDRLPCGLVWQGGQ